MLDKFTRETAAVGVAQCYARMGVDIARLPAINAAGRRAAAAAFVTAAAARPQLQFIVRPHPGENRDFYRQLIAEHALANVRFCPQDYIWNILNSTSVHLHRHCTTALEAWLWDKPTVEMAMDDVAGLAWPEREAGSDMAQSAEALVSAIDRYADGAAVDPERRDHRRARIEHWLGPTDGMRCRAAAQAIHECLLARGARARVPVKGLSATPRQIAGAIVRYAAGRRPNEPLLRRVPAAMLDPHDKQITRRDVRAYVSLVAAAAAS
jgi:hypothetical protein